MTVHAVSSTTAAVGRRAGGGHTTELVLAGELAAELGEVGDEVLAHLDHGLLGGDLAVGLDADEELGHIRVGDCFGDASVSASVSASASSASKAGFSSATSFAAVKTTYSCILP